MIHSIEIICIPCDKCQKAKGMIMDIIQTIEKENNIKLVYDFKHTANLAEINKYSLNPSQTPAIIVDGRVEIAGNFDASALKHRLDAIYKGY